MGLKQAFASIRFVTLTSRIRTAVAKEFSLRDARNASATSSTDGALLLEHILRV